MEKSYRDQSYLLLFNLSMLTIIYMWLINFILFKQSKCKRIKNNKKRKIAYCQIFQPQGKAKHQKDRIETVWLIFYMKRKINNLKL